MCTLRIKDVSHQSAAADGRAKEKGAGFISSSAFAQVHDDHSSLVKSFRQEFLHKLVIFGVLEKLYNFGNGFW